MLIGGKGDDVLKGGSGKNTYLIQEGDDTIEGGDGIDIIYIPKPKAEVELKNCSKTRCVASYKGEQSFEATITKGDVLIFLDGRNRLK